MATVAKLMVEIGAEMKALDSSLKKATDKLNKFGQSAAAIGSAMSTYLTAPVIGGLGLAVKAASDAEETFSKFATVFRDVGDEAESAFSRLRNEYGLSSTAAKQLLGDTGDLLTGFGFAQSEALRLSEEVQKLAVDLASFTNYSGGAEGASQALTKALLGERESVKALGIAIMEEDVQRQMAINTAKGLTFATERQAKAQATLDLAIQQSQNAIGDYARTSGSFANQMRLVQSRVSDLSVEFGQQLLPIAQKLVRFTKDLVDSFGSLDTRTKQLMLTYTGIVIAIGPAIAIIGKLALVLSALLSPVYLAIGAIALLTAAFLELALTFDRVIDDIVFNFKLFTFAVLDGVADMVRALAEVSSVFGLGLPASLMVAAESIDQFKRGFDFSKPERDSRGFVERLGEGFDMLTEKIRSALFDGFGGANLSVDVEANTQTFKYTATDIDRATMSAQTFGIVGARAFQSVQVPLGNIPPILEQINATTEILTGITNQFTASFGQGMANVIVQGEKLTDVLRNIGKLLLSSAIQKGISLLLTGGLSSAGTGFFGSSRGLFGAIGKLFTGKGGTTSMGDGMITSAGRIVKFSPKDNILAMKDFSALGSGMGTGQPIVVEVRGRLEGSGTTLYGIIENTKRTFR